jgi:lysophospholipase L1-like esterase
MTATRLFYSALILLAWFPLAGGQEPAFPLKAKQILFLGDSITHAGHYISLIEAQLVLASENPPPELINLGLPSETCSGLSEPDHPFPRPNVHERIDRALAKIKPDVVVACYGMNDGIYHPPSEQRMAAFRSGINKIIDKVHAAGAKLILMTPPAFDALPLKKKGSLLPAGADNYSWKTIYEDYDRVLQQYAGWIVAQADRVEMVIDLHTPVSKYVAAKRKSNPDFTMSPDGVHVNHEGHGVLATAILAAWGLERQIVPDAELMTLISKRQRLMHHAWLSEVGHTRPGVQRGLPMDQAKQQAVQLGKQIHARAVRQLDAASQPLSLRSALES